VSRGVATAVILGGAWLLAGCATVTTGTSQPINIDSEPQAAECTLLREGQTLGTITTPAPLTIKRHASTIHVVCKKAGYEDGRIVMNSRYETASAGNFLIGGVIGVIVDSSSGASSRYESNVLIRLTPLSPADQAAAVVARKPEPAVPVATAQPAGSGANNVSAAPAGPFDGSYEGGVELAQAGFGRYSHHLRRFDVQVSQGVGTGTVKHPQCDTPGKVELKIDPSGTIKGTANTQNTVSCTSRTGHLEGRMEGDRMRLTIRFENEPEPVAFVLARSPSR
jgi:hypothetical protein